MSREKADRQLTDGKRIDGRMARWLTWKQYHHHHHHHHGISSAPIIL